eukprot:TRINITY_DN24847_c0_g1_i1.p1 TRINITY_DN24847_c0_g1~~TRINITY_DN24847_c0_g1_i1.p1  ORF type:complete len:108 (+),score=1.68 TRINITY_DN24847_c0_g1_i1:80-403(+)
MSKIVPPAKDGIPGMAPIGVQAIKDGSANIGPKPLFSITSQNSANSNVSCLARGCIFPNNSYKVIDLTAVFPHIFNSFDITLPANVALIRRAPRLINIHFLHLLDLP